MHDSSPRPVGLLGTSEQQVGRPLPETIEDNLYGLHIWEFDSLERFFYFFHAYAIVANLSGFRQIVQDSEDLGAIVQFCWRAVELQQVNCVGGKISQAFFNARSGCILQRSGEANAGPLLWQLRPLPTILLEAGDQALASTITINVGGVDEIYATVDRFVQGGQSIRLQDVPPVASNGPCAETNI
jgi:hypothetical protein